MNKEIEILSPGGDVNAVKAAILAGANAVYLGLKKFNARKRAENITDSDLSKLLNIAHSRNVKIFITMNILLTEREVPEAVKTAARLIGMGIDAIIVQDPGFAFLLNKYFPGFEIHASTQMTTHNSLQIDFLKEFNFSQLNFSRELSGKELKPLIKYSHSSKIKTEIFVHGAYCISCSGICYMSSVISAQPGNRGACLQPCRRQYSTTKDNLKKCLLSLKDNNALIHAEDLINAGADTFKIEGRIKNFNYVYQVTNAWRQQIDSLQKKRSTSEDLQKKVEKVFNRDFSTGYYQSSISSEMLVDSPLDQSYATVGKVEFYSANKKELTLNTKKQLAKGNRINIYTPENSFICGAIIKKKIKNKIWQIEIENQLKGKILKDQIVLLLKDQNETGLIKQQIEQLQPQKHKLDITVSGNNNEYLKTLFRCKNKSVELASETRLSLAEKSELTKTLLHKQFGRLGNTFFELENIDARKLTKGLFIPVKELNNIRRKAIKYFSPVTPEYEFVESSAVEKTPLKKIALLISDNTDTKFIPENFDGLLFLETNTATRTEKFTKNILPWFPPFILEKDIKFYKDLICEIRPELVVSDNSGLGKWLGKNKFKWIAGPQLNCTNGSSFLAYKKNADAAGAFYSSEINKNQINDIFVPENFLTFYNIFGSLILMTTRQCLFQKPALCKQGKTKTDDTCQNGCLNYTKYFDEKNIPFHILKSIGHQNRIFNDAILFLPDAVNQIETDYFLLDFRNFPFIKTTTDENRSILNFFFNLISGNKNLKDKEKEIKTLIGKTTKGNYQRGFEE